MILSFESVHEYMRAVDPDTLTEVNSHSHHDAWAKGLSPARAGELAIMGDPTIVSSFTSTIADVTAGLETMAHPGYVLDVYGSRPDIGRYLAGLPTCMRRRAKRQTDTRHVAVYVSIVASQGVSADDLLKRGSAVLGFLATLQALQIGVDLYLVADMQGARKDGRGGSAITDDMILDGDCTQVIRVESRPLDLSQAGFVIAHPAFARQVTYEYGKRFGFQGGWSATFDKSGGRLDPRAYAKVMTAKLGLRETDVFIPPTHYDDDLIKRPLDWIRARVTQCLGSRLVA